MKISVPLLLVLLLAGMTYGRDGLAQDLLNRSVTVEVEQRELKVVLSQLEKMAKVRFSYVPSLIRDRKVSLTAQNQPLEEVLNKLLRPLHIQYAVSGGYIILNRESNSGTDHPSAGSANANSSDMASMVTAMPEDETISGKVSDEKGQGLPGVSVVVKGTTRGTTTDTDGNFRLAVPSKGTALVFSFVGYLPQEVTVGAQNVIAITMQPDDKTLSEVVVVGYGTQKKADVTGAIASISSTAITQAATPDATGALQGRVPGAVVVKNVGKPGSGYSISIRGTSSIGGSNLPSSNSPLYVIDGIPTTSGLNDLNPADIEKIDILKDASATAIYGSRGAKGVVIVTTKRGKSGKTTLSYDAYVGARVPVHLPNMFTGPEYVAFRTAMFQAQGKDVSRNNTTFFTPEQWANIDAGKFTDWPNLILKNGLQMNHNITASGGDDKTRFAISAGLLQENGNVSPESFKRYSLRGNVDRQINDRWRTGLNLYLVQSLQDLGSSEALRSAYRLPPITNPYDANGNLTFRVYGTNSVTNPVFDQENELRQNRNLRAFGNLYVQFQPTAELTLKSSISPNLSTARSGSYYGPLSKQSLGGSVPTEGIYSNSEQFTWVLDNQATYEGQWGEHKLTATAVQSMQQDRLETSNLDIAGLPYKSLWYNLGSGGTVKGYGTGYTKYTLSSFMGRANYNYKDKYLLTATGRWDGSSRLAEGNQWGFFPSASVAWRVSQEAFMKNITAINDLKFRVSYGVSGNDRVSAYSSQATLAQTYYDFGGTLALGYAPNQLANKDLTWELTKEINLGLDFGLLNNRITGTVDVYNRLIDNILLNRQLPAPSGFSSITDNIGKLRNTGVEIGLSTVNIHAGKFMWKSDFVFDANKNKILELYGGTKDDVGNSLFIGQPVQVNYTYVYDGIWQTSEIDQAAKFNQKPGQIRVKDLDNNGVINANDRQIIGKRVPSWTGSVGNTFRYGNVDLFVQVYTRQGEQFVSSFDATFMNYNADYNQLKVDYWTPTNPSQTWFQPGNPGPYSAVPTYRNVNFVRVGNITLGYNVPANLLKRYKINNLRIYGTATNPFLFTKYEGFDPEWTSTNTYGTAVSSASYLFGINLGF
ncbi:SusC/RagA family TonB-linked outer membrane protein [Spirosoma endbachense]|uniref:SusC/RagA family TonB-linked outer membrane protein n=2 Tax=Spirosoma endbachense TaxID=2666025 RepID=A0A6P1WBC5_9BACT|nr:SusC/RagA family TonB-linked outer membrane protein [Spirosoma endbachense]